MAGGNLVPRELQMTSEKIGIEIVSDSFWKVLWTRLIANVKKDYSTSSFSTNLQVFKPCFGSLTRETFFSKTDCLFDNSSFFLATALTCEGTTEGETGHSLLTWRTAKLSLF